MSQTWALGAYSLPFARRLGGRRATASPQGRNFVSIKARWAPQMPPHSGKVSAAAAAAADAAGSPATAGEVKGDMLAPSIFNNNLLRLAAMGAAVALAAKSSVLLPAQGLSFVHLLAYGTWLGSVIWTTFIAGIVMFKNLPRQTFGRLQSKLFPLYFGLSTAMSALLLGTLYFSGGAPPRQAVINLGIGIVGSLANLLWVEPLATSIMFKRYDLENAATRDDAAIKALYKQFGKWHGISSLFNLAVLVAAFAHGWWLAGLLVLA